MANVITILRSPHPLIDAFIAQGYSVLHTEDQPPNAELSDCALYLTDIFASIKTTWFLSRLKGRLNARGIPVVTWNRDAPWNCGLKAWRRALIKPLRLLDVYAAHSLQGAEYFADDPVYLPNACAIDRYHLHGRTLESLRDPRTYRFDVSFIGSMNPRYDRVRDRLRILDRLADRLHALGISTCFCDGLRMPVSDQVRLIQESRINLSVGAACDAAEASWGLPERCFGIPACGGFLLSDHRKHASDTFPGLTWVEFTNVDDCVDKIRYYLAHLEESRRIAEALHRQVIAAHTYRHRAEALVATAQAWRRCRFTEHGAP